jgi:hypothetical protein
MSVIVYMPEQKDEGKRLTTTEIIRLPQLKHEPWFEVIGEYLGSADEKETFHMAIRIKEKEWRISVPMKSREKSMLEIIEWLDTMPFQTGKKKRRVRILFTDDPEMPVKINSIEKI